MGSTSFKATPLSPAIAFSRVYNESIYKKTRQCMRLIIWPDPLICSAGQEDISPAPESLPGTRRDTASSQPTRRRSAGGRVPPALENCRILSSWPWSSCLSLSPWGWSAVDWRSGLDTEQHTPSTTQWQWLSLENILGKTTLNKLELTNTRPRRENIIEILCRTTNENKTRLS